MTTQERDAFWKGGTVMDAILSDAPYYGPPPWDLENRRPFSSRFRFVEVTGLGRLARDYGSSGGLILLSKSEYDKLSEPEPVVVFSTEVMYR